MYDAVWRSEKKYIISGADAAVLISRVSAILECDSYAAPGDSYTVRTLYFDDINNTALADKLAGNPVREKFRIRYYNGDTSFIRLEKKLKSDGGSIKQSAVITKQEYRKITDGDADFLLDRNEPLLSEFYARMRSEHLSPVSISQYSRRAFVWCPANVRITVDSGIAVSNDCSGFLEGSLPLSPVYFNGENVLEVKYNAFLPDFIARLTGISDRTEQGVSKYEHSRIFC